MTKNKRLAHHIRANFSMLVVVDIGTTDTDGLDLDQDFSQPWGGNRSFFDTNVVGCIEHRCLILHLLHLLWEQLQEPLRHSENCCTMCLESLLSTRNFRTSV